MAISSKERKILESLYANNKNLIVALLDLMANDDEVDPELVEKLRSLVSTRDYSKYIFSGEKLSKNRLVLAVVKQYVKDKQPKDFNELEKAFPKKLQGSKGVVKRDQDLSHTERKEKRFFVDAGDEIILADGTKARVCTQWTSSNIAVFIDHIKVQFNYTVDRA